MLDIVHKFLAIVPPVESVLEIGAYNVNGTARDDIQHRKWTGVDLRSGPCVDLVCDARALPFDSQSFDGLVCVETLEHCEDWYRVLSEGWRCLRVGGYAAVTVPSPGAARHEHPGDYWRFTSSDLLTIFNRQFIMGLMQYPQECGIIVRKLNMLTLRFPGDIMEAPPVEDPAPIDDD